MNVLTFLNSPFQLGSLTLPNRLIQGPLAGFSCAPFRKLFYEYKPPAYCVTEMLSAVDVIEKHQPQNRYLYRAPEEEIVAYQISGNSPQIMALAALKLQRLGANLIDINCGCPKRKIRKKGAGSALLENSHLLLQIVKAVREVLTCPLSVKIRLLGNSRDLDLSKNLEKLGIDALIIHGRKPDDDYYQPCNWEQIAKIKQAITIPVIVNGDITNLATLETIYKNTNADAFMISRAGTGKPWLYEEILNGQPLFQSYLKKIDLFLNHLENLALLESEFSAVLQSKTLVRYYFKRHLKDIDLTQFYKLTSLEAIRLFLTAAK